MNPKRSRRRCMWQKNSSICGTGSASKLIASADRCKDAATDLFPRMPLGSAIKSLDAQDLPAGCFILKDTNDRTGLLHYNSRRSSSVSCDGDHECLCDVSPAAPPVTQLCGRATGTMMAALMLTMLVIAGIIVWCTPGSDAKDPEPEVLDVEDSDDEDSDLSDSNKCSCCRRRCRRLHSTNRASDDALQLSARAHVNAGIGVVNPVTTANQRAAQPRRRPAALGQGDDASALATARL